MLDQKSKLILKILCNECEGGSYKIFETADLISSLPARWRTDSEGIQHILIYLERQDMINIKYDDDGVYCLAVMPYGRECAENESVNKKIKKDSKNKNGKKALLNCLLHFLIAFLASLLAVTLHSFIF